MFVPQIALRKNLDHNQNLLCDEIKLTCNFGTRINRRFKGLCIKVSEFKWNKSPEKNQFLIKKLTFHKKPVQGVGGPLRKICWMCNWVLYAEHKKKLPHRWKDIERQTQIMKFKTQKRKNDRTMSLKIPVLAFSCCFRLLRK